ncbi:hypothetical protein GCM10007887_22070 [Methylobacterium haplocladii]|uniref:Uncharacterized protein n=2 Tax=Methylobacterium haplocladii TaxID=1176176 RepID=A0A512ISQ4_9HYPH|nr:hypothetical protein MHA02_31220 [Methylobacterium haplocladii]GLS59538.1 hypothetical protein GCM10007887_22070 [Methylobacterium haplocladii]
MVDRQRGHEPAATLAGSGRGLDTITAGDPGRGLVEDLLRFDGSGGAYAKPFRAAMTSGIRLNIGSVEAALPASVTKNRRREAIGTYAAMLAALILVRAVDDPALSDEILSETRACMKSDLCC